MYKTLELSEFVCLLSDIDISSMDVASRFICSDGMIVDATSNLPRVCGKPL